MTTQFHRDTRAFCELASDVQLREMWVAMRRGRKFESAETVAAEMTKRGMALKTPQVYVPTARALPKNSEGVRRKARYDALKAAGLLRKHVKKLPSTQPVPVNPLFTTVWRTL